MVLVNKPSPAKSWQSFRQNSKQVSAGWVISYKILVEIYLCKGLMFFQSPFKKQRLSNTK